MPQAQKYRFNLSPSLLGLLDQKKKIHRNLRKKRNLRKLCSSNHLFISTSSIHTLIQLQTVTICNTILEFFSSHSFKNHSNKYVLLQLGTGHLKSTVTGCAFFPYASISVLPPSIIIFIFPFSSC